MVPVMAGRFASGAQPAQAGYPPLPPRPDSRITRAIMREGADFTLATGPDGQTVLAFAGVLRVSTIGALEPQVAPLGPGPARIDLAGVKEIDTAGAWFVWRLSRDWGATIAGESEDARRLIAAVSLGAGAEIEPEARLDLLSRASAWLGQRVLGFGAGAVRVLGFLGSVIASLGALIVHPGRFRWKALVHQMELVGVTSLGIIGLMSFLVGIVIAQQGAVQLAEFGAEMLTVNLTGRIALRELGILMTAIRVAGRSGSAFAAQLGTMKLTEEIDAMRTIGVSPMEALVVPRVLAAMLMLPLLGFFASVCAIVGGASISAVQLGIPFFTFLTRIQEVVPIHDFWVGVIKAPVFGLIIAVAGCYNGMQVKSNSEEVGLRTTMAVVAAIFMVIVLDAFFAVFFSEVGWG
jgi:phospholipid/cholesterol/gamma-HCH transport system permease protein